ncbi:hypothetical protein ACFVMC_23315 [Nocardia sp. NPDC127579]|uniref:hypothetical protein n=1 Tax=Nocardia sp. NPDC127579 TaxID=3345402 RepID=UPI00363238FC
MNDPSLSEATVQQVQLELIRRSSFNCFDGDLVADSLTRHRDLWLAAYMDRFGLAHKKHRDWFASGSLIKLRDLPGGRWNVDTLVVLTETTDQAQQLAHIAEQENWQADDVTVQDNTDELAFALGMWPTDHKVLSVWWD